MYFILRGVCDVVVIRRNSMPGPTGLPSAQSKLVVAQKREGKEQFVFFGTDIFFRDE